MNHILLNHLPSIVRPRPPSIVHPLLSALARQSSSAVDNYSSLVHPPLSFIIFHRSSAIDRLPSILHHLPSIVRPRPPSSAAVNRTPSILHLQSIIRPRPPSIVHPFPSALSRYSSSAFENYSLFVHPLSFIIFHRPRPPPSIVHPLSFIILHRSSALVRGSNSAHAGSRADLAHDGSIRRISAHRGSGGSDSAHRGSRADPAHGGSGASGSAHGGGGRDSISYHRRLSNRRRKYRQCSHRRRSPPSARTIPLVPPPLVQPPHIQSPLDTLSLVAPSLVPPCGYPLASGSAPPRHPSFHPTYFVSAAAGGEQ